MDIFISGDLNTFAPTITKALLANGHTVITSSIEGCINEIQHKNYVAYDMSIDDDLYPEIFTSHAFDAVIHILWQKPINNQKVFESGKPINHALLETALDLGHQTGTERFILISNLEVYGESEMIIESEEPIPVTPSGKIAVNAESLCQFYASDDFRVSIIRVPSVYGFEEDYSILGGLIRQSIKQKTVRIPFAKLAHCNFLHSDDLAKLISAILEDDAPGPCQTFNLGTEDINYFFLSQQLNITFPEVNYSFPEDTDSTASPRKIIGKNAKNNYNWNPEHNLANDLPLLAESPSVGSKRKKLFTERIRNAALKLRPFLVWIEVTVGAFLMHMFTVWTSTIVEFRVVDYRLIYVVLIGSIHGLLFGIIAAILAAASAAFSWNTIGLDFALLIYNVENWIPFAVYFLAGAVTGYVHDKQENDLQFEKHQTELIHEKYTFLYSLYNEISTIKNRLREQLVGYRDSFGRFFRIANELNEFDEDNIFFKALEILEDLMKNEQIAIYSIESTGHYGRLQVSSKTLTKDIPKSMRLADYAEALPVLKSGDVFQNKDLVANYPAYIAPIMNSDQLIGLVIIWEAQFDQFNMYYYNLFKVITGLIQSALVRAATFENAQYEKLYLPGTRIMRPESFKQTLAIRKKMRRSKVSAFQILGIQRDAQAWDELYEKIAKGIRSEDIVGILDENTNTCYIILANAEIENIGMIRARIEKNGLKSEHINDLEIE